MIAESEIAAKVYRKGHRCDAVMACENCKRRVDDSYSYLTGRILCTGCTSLWADAYNLGLFQGTAGIVKRKVNE